LTAHSLRIVFVLIVGLGAGICFAAQSASSSVSQADINNEVQAAYQAGTAAAANNDFKTAEIQFEKVVRLVPQTEESHSALGAVLSHLEKLPQAI
jgi:Flp pilus assembly protein TadD